MALRQERSARFLAQCADVRNRFEESEDSDKDEAEVHSYDFRGKPPCVRGDVVLGGLRIQCTPSAPQSRK